MVSHAVPLSKRSRGSRINVGVGAIAGLLLGGVFTDLVTWIWCFYFNLPVGCATVVSIILFFYPPKEHALMQTSFLYRKLELDLPGDALLLTTIMRFLALQLTEQ